MAKSILNKLIILLSVCVGFLIPIISGASSVLPMSLKDMVKVSENVVVARKISSNSYWDNGNVYTRIFFDVEQAIIGESIGTVSVTLLGGEAMHPVLKAKVSMDVAGGLDFSQTNEALLFLVKSKNSGYLVVGLSQGKFDVQQTEGGEKIIPVSQKVLESTQFTEFTLDQLFSPGLASVSGQSTITSRNISLDEMIEKIKASSMAQSSSGTSKK